MISWVTTSRFRLDISPHTWNANNPQTQYWTAFFVRCLKSNVIRTSSNQIVIFLDEKARPNVYFSIWMHYEQLKIKYDINCRGHSLCFRVFNGRWCEGRALKKNMMKTAERNRWISWKIPHRNARSPYSFKITNTIYCTQRVHVFWIDGVRRREGWECVCVSVRY